MKNILKFILIFTPWLLSGFLFSKYTTYYTELNLPFFALPSFLYSIVWIILYILIAISIYKIYHTYNLSKLKNYNLYLLINYLFNQLYLFFFFYLKNPFLGLIDTLIIFITSLFLYSETEDRNYNAAKYLKPYVIFNIYAVILSLTIYFMNL